MSLANATQTTASGEPVQSFQTMEGLRQSLSKIGDAREIQGLLQLTFGGKQRSVPTGALTPYEKCLAPLLETLNWSGNDRDLIENSPHQEPISDISALRTLLWRLRFNTSFAQVSTHRLTAESLPALVERSSGLVLYVTRKSTGDFVVFDVAAGCLKTEKPSFVSEKILLISASRTDAAARQNSSWFLQSLLHFKSQIAAVGLLALLTNVLALASPFYTAAVYNSVIGSRSLETLFYLLLSIALAISAELYLKHVKARLIAYVGARFHAALAVAALDRVLALQIGRIEQATVASQVSRFRQFQSIRTFFTGHLVSALLDLPFTLLFVAGMACISSVFVMIPLSLIAIYAAIAIVTMPASRRNIAMAGAAQSACQAFTAESLERAETIRNLGAEKIWARRFNGLYREAASQKFRSNVSDATLQAIAQALPTLAGIATLGLGSSMVISGELSVGGLIAVMMFIWRLLSPIQTAFLGMNNISQFVGSIRQVDSLMRMRVECEGTRHANVKRKYHGAIALEGVIHRYSGQIEPVLKNVSISIPPGQIVAITGPAGAGKSSFLKIILGLYQPAGGSVYIDKLNLQQLDPHDLRTAVGFVPQDPSFFPGTVQQNLQLSDPTTTPAMMLKALAEAGIKDLDAVFSEGLNSKLLGGNRASNSSGALMKLSLARAYLRQPRIYLFDDPGAYLDHDGDTAFIQKLAELRGKATIVIVTSRPSHIRACDRVVRIERGVVVSDSTPQAYLDRPKAAVT